MANPKKLVATVKQIHSHGDGVYTLKLKPDGRVPRYKAGQFLHFTLEQFDPAEGYWPESRVFSIASSQKDELLTILYSVKGVYTKRMEKELTIGSRVWLKLPYGEFIVRDQHESSDKVFIAGGTGISPFIPYFCNKVKDQEIKSNQVRLFYGARTKQNILFQTLFQKCEEVITGFEGFFLTEQESAERLPFIKSTKMKGRLNIEMVLEKSKILHSPEFYISGPPAMIYKFKEQLLHSGISAEKIITDEWE